MSPWHWFLLGFLAMAGPSIIATLLDELVWWEVRRRGRFQARHAKPFSGNSCQVFRHAIEVRTKREAQ